MNRRSGYTLLELLVAISIFSLVAAAIGTSAVACLKLCRTAVVEAELSLRARELREKLLFHVRLPTSTAAYDGLLSAPSTSRVDTVAFTYEGEQLPLTSIGSGNRVRQSHRLILAGSDDNTYPMDEGFRHEIERRVGGPCRFFLAHPANAEEILEKFYAESDKTTM